MSNFALHSSPSKGRAFFGFAAKKSYASSAAVSEILSKPVGCTMSASEIGLNAIGAKQEKECDDATVTDRPDRVVMTEAMVRVRDERDRAAFETLFVHYAPRVKGYLMRQGADAGSAEELAQEALFSAWRKAHLYDPAKASASTWIFAIARNLRIDALRKERRPAIDPDDPALIPDAEPGPDKMLERAEAEVYVAQALDNLPEDQSIVMRLSFFKGMPHGEIAEALDIPLGTVKSRLRLAFQKVKIALGEFQ